VNLDPEFDELKREFLSEAQAKVREISGLLGEPGAPGEARERMIYLAHQLKGAGGSYGFPTISSDAAALEIALEKMQDPAATSARGEVEQRVRNLEVQVSRGLQELPV